MSQEPFEPTPAAAVDTDTNSSTVTPKASRTWSRWLLRRLLMIGLIYVGLCVMLAMMQRKLIFHPKTAEDLSPAVWGLDESRCHAISVVTSDGLTLNGWHVLPPQSSALDKQERRWELEHNRPVILFFSGNAGHRGLRAERFDLLTGLQADLFVFDYRGYGDNPGVPSQATLTSDAREIWRYLSETEQIVPQRIVLYGQSLGGGVAAGLAEQLASEGTVPGGLFLSTTFSSLVETAGHHYPWIPVSWLLTERFPSADQIAELDCPIAVLHGRNDQIVPFELGEKLFAAAPERSASGVPKRFYELPGAGHNDVLFVARDSYLDAVAAMLELVRSQ